MDPPGVAAADGINAQKVARLRAAIKHTFEVS